MTVEYYFDDNIRNLGVVLAFRIVDEHLSYQEYVCSAISVALSQDLHRLSLSISIQLCNRTFDQNVIDG